MQLGNSPLSKEQIMRAIDRFRLKQRSRFLWYGIAVNFVLLIVVLAPIVATASAFYHPKVIEGPLDHRTVVLLSALWFGVYLLIVLRAIHPDIGAVLAVGFGFPTLLTVVVWSLRVKPSTRLFSSQIPVEYYELVVFVLAAAGLIATIGYATEASEPDMV